MISTLRAPLRWELLTIPGAVLLGAGVALYPTYTIEALGTVLLAVVLVRGALTRTVVVMAASLTLLQVSADTSLAKLAYLGTLLIATGFAAINLLGHWSRVQAISGQTLVLPAVLVAAVVALSVLVSATHGIDLASWVGDIPAYGILPAAVILGLDLAVSNHKPRAPTTVLFLAGLLSVLAFAIQWTLRHGVTSLDLGRFLFASMFLPAAALCLALAYAFDGRRTYRMAFFATGLLFAMLISATRSSVVFTLPILLTLLVAHGKRRWRIAALVVGGALMALILVTIVLVVGAGLFDFALIQARLGGLLPLLFSGDALSDPSLYLRFLQTETLRTAWLGSPWFGVGPGAIYNYSGITTSHPVDSPLAILTRFGVIGVAAFLVLFLTLLASPLRRRAHWVPATALLTFIGLIFIWSVLSSPLDDKGVALGLIPLIGLCGIWRREPSPPLFGAHEVASLKAGDGRLSRS